MPFSVVILVCAVALSPDLCTADTALDVVRGPQADNEMMCALSGQATLAATAIAPRAGEEYVKIQCSRGGAMRAAMNVAR